MAKLRFMKGFCYFHPSLTRRLGKLSLDQFSPVPSVVELAVTAAVAATATAAVGLHLLGLGNRFPDQGCSLKNLR